MAHWLLKSEPGTYAFSDLERDGRTVWDGVRNNAAALHLKAMTVGDEAFFYHSGDKAVVGVCTVAKAATRPAGSWLWRWPTGGRSPSR